MAGPRSFRNVPAPPLPVLPRRRPPPPAAAMPVPRAAPTPAGPPPPPSGAVVFVTDFGESDTYAAQMAGALLKADPRARVVAGFHAVPPQDVAAGADALAELVAAFPPGTTFVTVVDPGVGTGRAVLAASAGGMFHVAPDNGLLAALLDGDPAARAVRLPPHAGEYATFHGRDVMAPAAGRLTRGEPLEALGEATTEWARLDRPGVERLDGGAVVGRIMRADRFGNLITNVPRSACPGAKRVVVGGRTVPVGRMYADVPAGEPVALVGSNGRWEVAVRNGSAAQEFLCREGDPVRFDPS